MTASPAAALPEANASPGLALIPRKTALLWTITLLDAGVTNVDAPELLALWQIVEPRRRPDGEHPKLVAGGLAQ